MGAPVRRTADFHQKLLEAGVALFAETGYHGTGVKDIVARAGVPKGSFYTTTSTARKRLARRSCVTTRTSRRQSGSSIRSKRMRLIRCSRYAASTSASRPTTRLATIVADAC
ncbi:helix-turn-helix domain-containing protein [Paraburkholderia sp. BL6665CI2N2]|uniref:helix-turn-helix domain-containing protein n=1 Tax=Paraburkholderia sp. BL6665CI2N2 TaxID=1938806 RepID=UPI001FBA0F46|nr:helix-turn-helix domain-containing protein [Paraburkholderia sp. BL6665CI2N2]